MNNEFFYEFLCAPMSFKKVNRKKKFGRKFDFITGGWVGPDVLLSE